MAIKSVFFDLDGTLWNYRACSEYVMRVAADHLGRRVEDELDYPADYKTMLNVALLDVAIEDGLKNLSQSSYTRRFEKFLERCGIADLDLPRELNSHCHVARRLSVRAFLKEDAFETLVRLKNRGVSTGVLTNGTPAVKRNIIESLGLVDVLDHIVLCEAEGHVKPDTRIFRRCIKLGGANPEETLFVGDSFFTDLLGAKRAGAKAMLMCERRVKIPARVPPPDFALNNIKGILKLA